MSLIEVVFVTNHEPLERKKGGNTAVLTGKSKENDENPCTKLAGREYNRCVFHGVPSANRKEFRTYGIIIGLLGVYRRYTVP
jgi:hypothetical protein